MDTLFSLFHGYSLFSWILFVSLFHGYSFFFFMDTLCSLFCSLSCFFLLFFFTIHIAPPNSLGIGSEEDTLQGEFVYFTKNIVCSLSLPIKIYLSIYTRQILHIYIFKLLFIWTTLVLYSFFFGKKHSMEIIAT